MLSPWGPDRDGWGSSHLSVFVSSSLQSYWGIRLHSFHIFKVIFTTRKDRKSILFRGGLGFSGMALQPRSGFRGHHGYAHGHGWWQPDTTSSFEQWHQWHVFRAVTLPVCHIRGPSLWQKWVKIQVFYLWLKTHSIITCANHVYCCYLSFSQRLAQQCSPSCVPLLFSRNV